ncbi:hypothetical protein B9Z51_16825 [Limnohabitans sp. T6-5]|uniref:hypothetical protein n=1 Tax=Limnohabitans sp. T6-5 TaxID=1100724 RepID=UPI000D34B771|nr:hypothetical protein [Limnohabitans sp. T6-5]PUE06462.1 hypothetical protein B9Z51_16825 [Limnohabitans sp. T6-5]
MKTSKPILAGLALAVGVLTGCGGGGGGGDKGNTPASVNLSGNAAKGALMDADVNAYEIINGLQSTSMWAHTTTDATGAYTLKAAPTGNPVVVEVVANAKTTMLDETQIETDGSFKKVSVPSLTLRTFVASLNEEATSVQVNPITEAAIAMAQASVGTDKKLSIEVLTAAKQVALQMAPLGTSPFSDKPALKTTEMSVEQTKFSAMMAGLIKSADANCNLPCQVGKLSKGIKIDVGSDGKGTLSGVVASAIQTKRTELLTMGQAAWLDDPTNFSRLGDKKDEVKTATASALSASKTNAVPTSTKPTSEFTAAEGLEGFITAMRNGFRATEKNLLKANDELNAKYKDMSLESSEGTIFAINRIKQDCFENKSTFACTNSPGSHIQWTKNGDTWTGKVDNTDGTSTWEGTVSGSIVNGTINATLNGVKKNKSNGKLQSKFENLNIMAHKYSTTEAGSFNINGTIWAYDKNSDLKISLTAKDWKATLSKTTDMPQKGTLSGEVTLAASNGDVLTGTLAASGHQIQITHNYSYYCGSVNLCSNSWTENDVSWTDIRLHLSATNNNSQLLALDVTGTQNAMDLNQAEGASNFTKYSLDATAVLTDTLTLKINGSQSEWNTENYAFTIASGGSEVKVSGMFTINEAEGIIKDKWCNNTNVLRCAIYLDLKTANNVYTAKLTRLNGKPQGDIYKGSTQVGVIKDGIIQVNGRDVSIY